MKKGAVFLLVVIFLFILSSQSVNACNTKGTPIYDKYGNILGYDHSKDDIICGSQCCAYNQTCYYCGCNNPCPKATSTPKPTNTPTPTLIPTKVPTNTPIPTGLTPTGPTPTTNPNCPKKYQGDANCDGTINLLDFEIWRSEYTGSVTTKTADFNSDNSVSLLDFEIWRTSYTSN